MTQSLKTQTTPCPQPYFHFFGLATRPSMPITSFGLKPTETIRYFSFKMVAKHWCRIRWHSMKMPYRLILYEYIEAITSMLNTSKLWATNSALSWNSLTVSGFRLPAEDGKHYKILPNQFNFLHNLIQHGDDTQTKWKSKRNNPKKPTRHPFLKKWEA